MQIQQLRPTQVQLTLHSLELATLVAAARWIAAGCEGTLPPAALDQLSQVLINYDRAWQQQRSSVAPPATSVANYVPKATTTEVLPYFFEQR